jgi:PTS system mannose-specific IIB component
MGKIQLTRIDDRLIHGQVMTKWSKGLGINAIFIVDNDVAKDDFMKQIYISSGSRSGLHIKALSTDEVVSYWKEKGFEEYKVLLLFKSIGMVYEAVQKGLVIETLNVGGISKKKDSKLIISSVNVTDEDVTTLSKLKAEKIDIFFQTIPDSLKVSFEDGMKKIV